MIISISQAFKTRKGIIISVIDPGMSINIGEVYYCGDDAWKIVGMEQSKRAQETDDFYDVYLLLMKSIDKKGILADGSMLFKR